MYVPLFEMRDLACLVHHSTSRAECCLKQLCVEEIVVKRMNVKRKWMLNENGMRGSLQLGGMNWESGIHMHALPCVKQMVMRARCVAQRAQLGALGWPGWMGWGSVGGKSKRHMGMCIADSIYKEEKLIEDSKVTIPHSKKWMMKKWIHRWLQLYLAEQRSCLQQRCVCVCMCLCISVCV